jgi:HPt (histidine-containing phosphotransfer) domain-containing protein
LSDDNDRLDLCASAGIPPIFPSVRTAELWICRTLSEGRPHLSNDIASDPLFGNREWALTEGLVGYAGHPMISRGRPIGVISLFSRQPLAGDVLGALSLASGSIALLVERSHAETRLDTAIEEAQSRPPLLPAEFSSALRRPTPGCAERIQVRATAGLEDLIPGYLASQKRGIEALAQAVDRGDFPTARKIGHGMKGSGASYGFPAITDSGSHIEQCAIARDAPGIARHIADMSDFLSRLEVIY